MSDGWKAWRRVSGGMRGFRGVQSGDLDIELEDGSYIRQAQGDPRVIHTADAVQCGDNKVKLLCVYKQKLSGNVAISTKMKILSFTHPHLFPNLNNFVVWNSNNKNDSFKK